MSQNLYLNREVPKGSDQFVTAIFYFFLGWFYIFIRQFQGIQMFLPFIKPLPMLVLVISIHQGTKISKALNYIQIGFFLALLGDFVIQLRGSIGIHSVILYTLCQVLYIMSLATLKNKVEIQRYKLTFITFLGVSLITSYSAKTVFNKFEFPINLELSIYALTLSISVLFAIVTYQNSTEQNDLTIRGKKLIFVGCLLLFITDISIVNDQLSQIMSSGLKQFLSYFLLCLYWLAQYLIYRGSSYLKVVSENSYLNVEKDQ